MWSRVLAAKRRRADRSEDNYNLGRWHMKAEELSILLRGTRVHVDRDLIAQWAGEQLIAAALAESEYRPIHRKRSRLLLDALRQSRVSADLPALVRSTTSAAA